MEEGTTVVKYVEKKGNIPVRVEKLDQFKGSVASYAWELHQMGLQTTDINLYEDQKVLAVTRREHVWVMYLEQFFDSHKHEIDQWLNTSEKWKRQKVLSCPKR